jgi:poly(3-hydroxybutyrate) depolymerase
MNASPSPARPPQHLLRGKSPFFACTADRRFLFAVYTPTTHDPNSDPPLPLVVALHGAARDMRLLDRMGEWAESARCAVLAPLFPCGADDYDGGYNNRQNSLLLQPDAVFS